MLNAKRRTWLRFADRGPRAGVPLCSGASTILPTVKHLFDFLLTSAEPLWYGSENETSHLIKSEGQEGVRSAGVW